MPAIVLDASVILAVALPDEDNEDAARAVDLMARGGALLPVHWLLEVANGLLIAERRKRISRDVRKKALGYIVSLPFDLDDRLRDLAWTSVTELAVAYGLTLYDAVYLELALRSGLPLASLDGKLRAAAQKEKVPLFPSQ
jgi:predicted nucleic acid-binding protein